MHPENSHRARPFFSRWHTNWFANLLFINVEVFVLFFATIAAWGNGGGVGHTHTLYWHGHCFFFLVAVVVVASNSSCATIVNWWLTTKQKVHSIWPCNYIGVCDGPPQPPPPLLLFSVCLFYSPAWVWASGVIEAEYASRKNIRYYTRHAHHFPTHTHKLTKYINVNCSLTTFDNSSPKQK